MYLWDLRMHDPVRRIQAHKGGMSQLAVHEHAPIIATASGDAQVKVWNLNNPADQPISQFGSSVGFLGGSRGGAGGGMASMAFHPHHMVLGCALGGGQIGVYEMVDYRAAMKKVQAQNSPLGIVRGM